MIERSLGISSTTSLTSLHDHADQMASLSYIRREPAHIDFENRASRRRLIARIGLAVYVFCVATLSYARLHGSSQWDTLGERPDGSVWIMQVVTHVAIGVAVEIGLFFIVGLLAGASCASTDRASGYVATFARVAVAFLLSVVIAIIVSVLLDGTPLVMPPFPITAAISLACLWGCNLGATWVRAKSQWRWLFGQAFATALMLTLVGGAVVLLSTTNQPLQIADLDVSTEDRRRLVKLVREHDPRKLPAGTTTDLTLTQSDLNQLAFWALSLLGKDASVELQLADGRVHLNAMLELPQKLPLGKYLTIQTGGQVIARSGELGFRPDEFQISRLRAPDWLLDVSGPFLLGREWRYEETEPFFRSLQNVDVAEREVTVTYGPLLVEKGAIREALVGIGLIENLEASVNAQVQRLEAMASKHPQVTFGQCMEASFDEAAKRSLKNDPIRENRAAILALSYLIAHQRVGKLISSDPPMLSPASAAKLNRVNLRGRRDWAQHFTLSAALEVLSGASASRDLGILKEELDADGGSGFSFGDLLADRSGTMMAVRSTGSEQLARAMQERIRAGFNEEDFIPEGADLPEGLPDDEFQSKFGGVGGEAYQALVEEIDARIDQCAAYQ